MGYCCTFHPLSYIEKNGVIKVTRTGSAGFDIDVHQNLFYIFEGHSFCWTEGIVFILLSTYFNIHSHIHRLST